MDAIDVAWEYIYEHGTATRDEIVHELVLEENYPLGHNDHAAIAKGMTTGC